MDADNHRPDAGTGCCDAWWGSLTPVQRMWLHLRLWDLEILAGWTSDVVVQALRSDHGQIIRRYTPTYAAEPR